MTKVTTHNEVKKKYIDNLRVIEDQVQEKLMALQTERWGQRYPEYRNNWSEARKQKIKTHFPMHIDLDTTDSCNLQCSFCWAECGDYGRQNEKHPISSIDRIFDEASAKDNELALCSVNIGTLGEPLLFPEVAYHILERCNDVEVMDRFMHSNGHFLTIDRFIRLQELGLTHLLISLDAVTSETYLKVRGRAKFNDIVKSLQDIAKYKKEHNLFFPVIRISMVETDVNTHEREEFISFFSELAEIVEVQPLVDHITEVDTDNMTTNLRCHQPWQRMQIGVKGEMSLCCAGYNAQKDFYIDLFESKSISETWQSDQAEEMRAALHRGNLKNNEYCYKCLAGRLN